MSDQQPASKVHIGRRVKNTLDRPFHVVFFERIYAGAPRWWSSEWEKHYRTPSGGNGYCLEREREVKKHLQLSHNPKYLFNEHVPYLLACTNINCSLRTWEIVNFLTSTLASVESEKDFAMDDQLEAAERNDFSNRIKADLHRVSLGKDVPVGKNSHMEKCPHCQRPKMVSGIAPVRNKWIYVLHGSDGPLKPHTEIYLETPGEGDMYQDFQNGAFNPRRKQQYPGYFPIEKADGEVWQFFLSPVRLGPKAISMLSQSRKTDGDWADTALDALEDEETVIDTGWDPTQQPWCSVVSRKFSPGQVKTPCEPVALVDPFSWAGQASDLDYLPIAAARQALLNNSEEQAKAFIAATLAPAKGEEQDEHHIEQTDPWDLEGQTVEVPPEYKASGNIAQAWVDRYKEALEYLERETRFACCRVIFAVRFSQAHRIVELACQENTGDPDALAFGLIHWAHILREMLVCEPGKSFIAWLTKSRGAAERIPRKNVLANYKSDPRAKDIGPGLPAQVLSYLSPVLLRESHNFAEDFRRYAEEIEIEIPIDWEMAILAPETVKPLADIAFSIPEKYLHHYIHHFPEELHVGHFHAFNGAHSWKARIMGLSKLKDLLRVAALLRCVFEFGEEYKGPDTGWGNFGHVVEKIETPVKIAEFGVEQAKLLIEAGYGEELEEVAEHIARHGTKGLYGELVQKKLLKAANALKAMKVLEAGEKILSGPVGFLMGGFEVMLQEHESLESMESGDLNAAMAHQIKALAGGLVAVVGALETLALIGVVGEMAWLGPVGWVAAGLMLLGEIYVAYGKKTDYQLFAAHCFLGKEAGPPGEETSNLPWMGDMTWEQLAEPRYGRLALLRLVSTFSVWIGWYPLQYEGPWWQIKSKFVPAGACYEVEVDFWNLPLKPDRVTQKARIWPDGKLQMKDSTGCAVQVSHYGDGTVFAVKITPRSLFPPETNWDNIRFEWGVRVRLVLDREQTLPAKGWVENQHGTISSEKSTSGE